MIKKNKKIVVGMSGGVDSSISLILLKKQGWSPLGVSLKLPVWQSKKNLLRENICCTQESLEIARKICQKIKVPFYLFDVRPDFQKKVVNYFVAEFENYGTPNPCVICNRYLKFASLFKLAAKVGAKYVATGHYAQIKKDKKSDKYQLLRAKDENKDQTYNLCFLPQKWLKNIIFPLGDYTKNQVYQMAKDYGFDFFLKKKQSQDFCFVAAKSLPLFLGQKLGKKPGKIIDSQGNVLGKHQGLHFFTIGQRKGLNLSQGPWFVKDLDIPKNLLIVTREQKTIRQKTLFLSPFNFISGQAIKNKIKIEAKIRYRHSLSPAILYPPRNKQLKLIFQKPQKAVSPGQFAVFYQNKICLGGGRINH